MENQSIKLKNPLMYDKLRTLADEYSISIEVIINLAVSRLIDDVELLRKLRAGEVKLE